MSWWWKRQPTIADLVVDGTPLNEPLPPIREIGSSVSSGAAILIEGRGKFLQRQAYVAEHGAITWAGTVADFLAMVRQAARNANMLECRSGPVSAADTDSQEARRG